MDKDIVIDINNISKKYPIIIGYHPTTLQERISEFIHNPIKSLKNRQLTKEFWALKDISFQVKRGEILGIIGKNGAGKSTLLKILSRITEPTFGQITMKGKVASLLEVGTGFNPELTGRDNIYLNGAIIGMGKKEINDKFEDIVKFSGIGEFIDTPVKRYSSGMYVRLAFAVAAHLDADILIVDEVLAVGDADFQKKSFNRIIQMVNDGRTVLLVSHNMSAISKFCNRVIYMKNGKLISSGTADKGISEYLHEDFKEADRQGVMIEYQHEKWIKDEYTSIKISWPKGKFPNTTECDVVGYNSKRDKIFVIQSQFANGLETKPKIISGFEFRIKNIGFTQDIYIDIGLRDQPDEYYKLVLENAVVLQPDRKVYRNSLHKDNIVTPDVKATFI